MCVVCYVTALATPSDLNFDPNWYRDVIVEKMAAPQLVDMSKHEFREPQRLVKGPEDMGKWLTCQVSSSFSLANLCIAFSH